MSFEVLEGLLYKEFVLFLVPKVSKSREIIDTIRRVFPLIEIFYPLCIEIEIYWITALFYQVRRKHTSTHIVHTTTTHIEMTASAEKVFTMYYHHFPFEMLTKTERFLLHSFLLSFVLFIGFGIYSYLPASIMFSLSRAYYYIFGVETTSPLSALVL